MLHYGGLTSVLYCQSSKVLVLYQGLLSQWKFCIHLILWFIKWTGLQYSYHLCLVMSDILCIFATPDIHLGN